MATVTEHYEGHLAPVYLWMAGGAQAALEKGEQDLASFAPAGTPAALAVDLGCGFGMHAIPMARRGWHVVAVDTSRTLLDELARLGPALPIRPVLDDLLNFRRHAADPADLIVCLGDTLTHLGSRADVQALLAQVSAGLSAGGSFVARWRDYRQLPQGEARFIPVRADGEGILTCFLEEQGEHVLVHDVLHERQDGSWKLRVSSYRKLRLDPQWLVEAGAQAGLACQLSTAGGMLQLQARRAP